MTTESCENNSNNGGKRVTSTTAKNPVAEQEQLPCPRCESTNTKFCYYNNYNFSQPRHFCKSCRRYWTHGGTLRDIPVGGGTRKNAKRCRTIPSTTPISSNHNMSMNMMTATVGGNGGSALQDYPLHATPVLVPFEGGSAQLKTGHMNGPTFASLLSTQGPGFLALGGFGLGLGSGFVADGGYSGLGRGFWGLTEGGAGADAGAGGAIPAGGIHGNAWQFESGEATPASAFGTADCFSWPDLAISTPGNSLK